jgi:hypothetical protein
VSEASATPYISAPSAPASGWICMEQKSSFMMPP